MHGVEMTTRPGFSSVCTGRWMRRFDEGFESLLPFTMVLVGERRCSVLPDPEHYPKAGHDTDTLIMVHLLPYRCTL